MRRGVVAAGDPTGYHSALTDGASAAELEGAKSLASLELYRQSLAELEGVILKIGAAVRMVNAKKRTEKILDAIREAQHYADAAVGDLLDHMLAQEQAAITAAGELGNGADARADTKPRGRVGKATVSTRNAPQPPDTHGQGV